MINENRRTCEIVLPYLSYKNLTTVAIRYKLINYLDDTMKFIGFKKICDHHVQILLSNKNLYVSWSKYIVYDNVESIILEICNYITNIVIR